MDMFYQGAEGIFRTVAMALMAYTAVVAMIRVSGKRTLAKLNAFDLIVTVALGSTLASTILTQSVPLVEGAAAFATLIGLQWIVAWTSLRSKTIARAVRSEPRLLMRSGEILHDALREERITVNELMAVIRSSAAGAPEKVAALILEANGTFSIVARDGPDDARAYAEENVQRPTD
ncbi:DUF421 domain-containing protein [Palleronia sediminis]|uniref:DUF421 domain-containing protein n=1 Tax=Palleronia sediminis TaxID=2547833 RepID=A0A4V3BAP3_9RHOB|nr:YetF domain-containing protein [Palleronia sediminis]TDL83589.1 DUF421 domain-containing protein [Palleronia sediminis]